MNVQAMLADLCRLKREWERNYRSPDLLSQKDWTAGVTYGIWLGLRLVRAHVKAAQLGKSTRRLDQRVCE
jgi:hypothetical protein